MNVKQIINDTFNVLIVKFLVWAAFIIIYKVFIMAG